MIALLLIGGLGLAVGLAQRTSEATGAAGPGSGVDNWGTETGGNWQTETSGVWLLE